MTVFESVVFGYSASSAVLAYLRDGFSHETCKFALLAVATLAWRLREVWSGAGTCTNVHEPPHDGTFWPAPHFQCSVCGHRHVSLGYVFYCPSCGRKVVDK